MKYQSEKFVGAFTQLPGDFLTRLDRMFAQTGDVASYIQLEVRQFVDATSGATSVYLPPIATNRDKDYYFVKIDSSVNAVTIYPAGTDTIEGATSLALAAQYDWAKLRPNNGVWYLSP